MPIAENKEYPRDGHVAKAQYYIALIYIYGLGTPKDKDKGLKYLDRAADNGDEDAITMRTKIDWLNNPKRKKPA